MDSSSSSSTTTTALTSPGGTLHPSWRLRRRNSAVVNVPFGKHRPSPLSTPKPRHSSSFPSQNGAAVVTPRHHQRPPHLDLELLSIKSSESYTSLKDLLPSSSSASNSTAADAAHSPSPNHSGYEISIRNRLVKQAAWAYLQPMSSTCGPSGPHFFRRLSLHLSSFLRRRLLPFLACLCPCLSCFHLS